ncbi:hypothetical protein BKA56DRAFT_33246 [Ilyonectria sp. MPI-CAGE-AT-0026]|nr:hypothetical protein BKA56DRAFT_33246 [Ilyonectria sp. MPI-CAGE-AT-0026]
MLGDAAQPRPRPVARCLSFLAWCMPASAPLPSLFLSLILSLLCSALLSSEPLARPSCGLPRGSGMVAPWPGTWRGTEQARASRARARHVFLSVEGPARARHGITENTVVRGPWDDAGVRQKPTP